MTKITKRTKSSKIISLVRFQLSWFLKTTYFIAPFVTLLIILNVLYEQPPVQVISSFSMTALCEFILMVWVGYSYEVNENEVMSQVLHLRFNQKYLYEFSQNVMHLLIAVAIAVVTVTFPIIKNILLGFSLFSRSVQLVDIISALLITSACGFLGACLGRFFGSRTFQNRKMALLLLILTVSITVAKGGIIMWLPVSRFILWIVPPVINVITMYTVKDRYAVLSVLAGFFLLFGYGILISIICAFIHKKKGFN